MRRFSAGTRTPEGEAKLAANGKKSQRDPCSIREVRADLTDVYGLLREVRARCALMNVTYASPR